MSFNRCRKRIIWSSFQSVHGPDIHDVRSFTVRVYCGIPNLKFGSFGSVRGLCDPRTCVPFLILFICGLPLIGLCFRSDVPVVFRDGARILIA